MSSDLFKDPVPAVLQGPVFRRRTLPEPEDLRGLLEGVPRVGRRPQRLQTLPGDPGEQGLPHGEGGEPHRAVHRQGGRVLSGKKHRGGHLRVLAGGVSGAQGFRPGGHGGAPRALGEPFLPDPVRPEQGAEQGRRLPGDLVGGAEGVQARREPVPGSLAEAGSLEGLGLRERGGGGPAPLPRAPGEAPGGQAGHHHSLRERGRVLLRPSGGRPGAGPAPGCAPLRLRDQRGPAGEDREEPDGAPDRAEQQAGLERRLRVAPGGALRRGALLPALPRPPGGLLQEPPPEDEAQGERRHPVLQGDQGLGLGGGPGGPQVQGLLALPRQGHRVAPGERAGPRPGLHPPERPQAGRLQGQPRVLLLPPAGHPGVLLLPPREAFRGPF
ncbi:hypothetical protein HWI79_3679 [Cryptosporidium felis]|nr:hypothetical protein HWI79_3679 [Cryptosporidium felis]